MQPQNYQPANPVAQPAPLAPVPQQPPQPELSGYISNPFLVGLRSLIDTLRINPVAVLLTPLALIGGMLVAGIFAGILFATRSAVGNMLGIILMVVLYLVILPIALGMYYTIAARSLEKQQISTKEAFAQSLKKAFPMLGLIIISILLTMVGFMLFIIPGIIFLVRASLAPVVMYTENLGVFESLKRSFVLTKGHFVEVFAAVIAGGIFGSNGLLAPYFGITQMVGRYSDLKALQEANAAKPKVHWVNYLVVAIVPLVVIFYGAVLTVSYKDAQNKAKQNEINSQNIYNNLYDSDSFEYKYDY